ncbi:hypothetical protein CCACVL1_05872 [Corchorus capsularis]|uniref:Uncharacterized protein n=1 Tax=Corchorus capsularis TaxID=210143 RepID=A0A1R3JIN6_COCAP|nr:hypothetical protein CCACVL1_05872 [Corchorus capsularis]
MDNKQEVAANPIEVPKSNSSKSTANGSKFRSGSNKSSTNGNT